MVFNKMIIQIYGHNLEVTDALRQYAEEKIGHINHIMPSIERAHVTLGVGHHHLHGEIFNVEVQVAVGKHSVHVTETADDLYAAIDLAEAALLHQVRKIHTKQIDRRQRIAQALSPRRYLDWGKRFLRRRGN